jgi:hypothetical protein
VSQQYVGRGDVGQSWAEGDLCPLVEADRCTGRLREIECPQCGGAWQWDRRVASDGNDCPRCDLGSVFVCDTCEWSS